MKTFLPKTGSLAEWNAAYYRVEDYLRAHLVVNKLHRNQIVLCLLQKAAAKHVEDPSKSPTTLALEEAWSAVDQWFGRLLPTEDVSPERLSAMCRVSMLILDATERWPVAFLAQDEEIPDAFRSAMQATTLQAGPDLQVSSMVPRPIDMPIDISPLTASVEEVWERISRLSVGLFLGATGLVAAAILLYLKS